MSDNRESENSVQTVARTSFKAAQCVGAVFLALESCAFAIYLWRQHPRFCGCLLVFAFVLAGYTETACIPTEAFGLGPWDPVKQEFIHVPWYRDELTVETVAVLTMIILVCIIGRDALFMPDIGFPGMLRLSKASPKARKRLKRIKKAQEKLEAEMTQDAIVSLVKELRIGKQVEDRDRRAEYRKRLTLHDE